jgi:hypothetical protein
MIDLLSGLGSFWGESLLTSWGLMLGPCWEVGGFRGLPTCEGYVKTRPVETWGVNFVPAVFRVGVWTLEMSDRFGDG